jgi:predicted Zn-dependent peptidase
MNIYKIPIINPEIFTFWLYFYGDDSICITGERHFLEHLLLGSNSQYDKDAFRKEISRLGDDSLFSAATHTEYLTLSGSYLVEDAPRVMELLTLMLNHASLSAEEIENEREIIIQEYQAGVDNLLRQCYRSLEKLLGVTLLAIGDLDGIKKINRAGLLDTRSGLINSDACSVYVHCPGIENMGGSDWVEYGLSLKPGSQVVVPFQPKGEYHAVNENISSSLVMLLYDEPFSLKQALLTSYLGSTSGPLFTELRERQQLCYSVAVMETFCGKIRAPYMTSYGLTTKDPELLVKGLHDNFLIEDKDGFESLIKGNQLNYARVKSSIEERLAMEKLAVQLGTTFEELANWPTWEQFREYGYAVKEKGVHATMVVERGKD